MSLLIGNLMYWAGSVVAALFVMGAFVVLLTGLGESPSMAAGFATALALLSYGFGWSSRRLLHGRNAGLL